MEVQEDKTTKEVQMGMEGINIKGIQGSMKGMVKKDVQVSKGAVQIVITIQLDATNVGKKIKNKSLKTDIDVVIRIRIKCNFVCVLFHMTSQL